MRLDPQWLREHYAITDDQLVRRKAFLAELEVLMRKHNVSIGHQDGQGAFEFHDFDEDYLDWIRGTHGGIYE